MKKSHLIRLVAALFLLLSSSVYAGETPTEMIKNSNKKISELSAQNANQQAVKKIAEYLDNISNFKSLSESVTAGFCKNLKAEECKEFNITFIELLKYSTAKKLSNYKSEKTEYKSEEISGNNATVKTIVKNGDKEFKVDYVLEKNKGKWQIVNYIVEDINTADNYRKQFSRLFKKQSFDKIIDNLNKKVASYKSGKGD